MNLQLQDKHVLITGGSKGIGLACAQAFLAEGARVTLVARSADTLAQGERWNSVSRRGPGARRASSLSRLVSNKW